MDNIEVWVAKERLQIEGNVFLIPLRSHMHRYLKSEDSHAVCLHHILHLFIEVDRTLSRESLAS